jgi:hypothetical protein
LGKSLGRLQSWSGYGNKRKFLLCWKSNQFSSHPTHSIYTVLTELQKFILIKANNVLYAIHL